MLISIMILIMINQANSFFVYNDCDKRCINRNESCVISETTKEYFPCNCLESKWACSMIASRIVVCLQSDGVVQGGEDIWNDFDSHRKSTTTTPRPTPDNHTGKTIWTSIGLFAGFLLLVCVVCVSVKMVLTRREYERIRRSNEE